MSERYALRYETLAALGLEIEDDRYRQERIGGAWRVFYVLEPWDLRLLRRLVELLTGEPLGDESQVWVVADSHLRSIAWLTAGGIEAVPMPGTERATGWLHAVCLAAVSVANERGSGAHRPYADRGEGWEVCDG